MVLCYVDDVLIISNSASVERRIIAAIQQRVPVKITGRIHQHIDGGGSITFIGRTIRRWPGSKAVEVFVRTAGSKPLSPEAYSRFRRALGKILWLAQKRQDIKFAVGLLSTQQAAPRQPV